MCTVLFFLLIGILISEPIEHDLAKMVIISGDIIYIWIMVGCDFCYCHKITTPSKVYFTDLPGPYDNHASILANVTLIFILIPELNLKHKTTLVVKVYSNLIFVLVLYLWSHQNPAGNFLSHFGPIPVGAVNHIHSFVHSFKIHSNTQLLVSGGFPDT